MHLGRIKNISEEKIITLWTSFAGLTFFLSTHSAVLLMYGTEKCLWVRLFEVVFAHLKAGSDQRQVLTSSQGNAAWTDQYTEQDLATKNKTHALSSHQARSLKFSLKFNLSCHMCNSKAARRTRPPLTKPRVRVAMIFLFLQGYWLGVAEHLLHFVENVTYKDDKTFRGNPICKCFKSIYKSANAKVWIYFLERITSVLCQAEGSWFQLCNYYVNCKKNYTVIISLCKSENTLLSCRYVQILYA